MNEERWSSDPQLRQINLHAAGIDIGSQSSWVAVPPGSHATPVREFGMFTSDLEAMRDRLWAETTPSIKKLPHTTSPTARYLRIITPRLIPPTPFQFFMPLATKAAPVPSRFPQPTLLPSQATGHTDTSRIE